jgi:hypothetical protein
MAPLHGRDLARHVDDGAGIPKSFEPPGLTDEMAQHVRRGLEICDHPVAQGLDGGDLFGSATEHLSGGGAHRLYTARSLAHRDDRRLVHHNTLISFEDEGVGGAEIDCQIGRKPAEERR